MESAADYLPQARWQRCMVNFYRNVLSHVPATKIREVSLLKSIHAQESRDAADKKARRRHTYRFFSFALAVLPRTTFAATRRLGALPGSAGRAAAALVTRTPG
jgi:transposase-like protein